MPLYDFKCPTCSKTVEKLVKVGTVSIECLNCGSAAVKQLSAPGGIMSTGAGFYKPSAPEPK